MKRAALFLQQIVLGVLLAAIGCGSTEQWKGTVEERDGVVYVRNPREGLLQERNPTPIRFELEQTFGVEAEPREGILGSIGYQNVAVDDRGNVYVYDRAAGQLVSFAADGSLRWKVGASGQGPGEFFNAQGVVWDGAASIYVTNAGFSRIDQWTTGGEFEASHLLTERGLPSGTALGFIDGNTLVLQARLRPKDGLSRAGGLLGIIDLGTTPWAELVRREVDVGDSELRFSGFYIAMNTGIGYVSVGDFDSYEFRIFDRLGELQQVVARDFAEMIGYPIADAPSTPYSSLSAPLRLATGHWLTSARWINTDEPAADYAHRKAGPGPVFGDSPFTTSIDLFDPDGRFLYSFHGDPGDPLIGYLETVASDGKLYTSVSDPFPQVRRYNVVVNE